MKEAQEFKCSSKAEPKSAVSGQGICKFHCQNGAIRLNQVQSVEMKAKKMEGES
jgi:hypothetical protein